ncbi:unnamed protein product [Gordionus sp. m RMFG-2023]
MKLEKNNNLKIIMIGRNKRNPVGLPISPVVVDKLYLFAAKTYDVLIEPIDLSKILDVWDYKYLAFEMSGEGDDVCYIERGIQPAHLDFSTYHAYIKGNDLISLSPYYQIFTESVDKKSYFFVFSFAENMNTLGCINVLYKGSVIDILLKPQHPCDRPCDDEPMECHYDFQVTFSRSMLKPQCGNCPEILGDCYLPGCIPVDGNSRSIFLVNEMLPGPDIRVCENDIVIVNVTNNLLSGESLAIHWHGLHHKKTPFMDGVPFITQCLINHGTTFRYKFIAHPPGTRFWHAHVSFLRDNGVAGSFVIRTKHYSSDPNHVPHQHDLNKVAFIQDWSPRFRAALFLPDTEGTPPQSILVNGRSGDFDHSPPAYFLYKPVGQKLYLRLVSNGFLFCPISLSIRNHKLKVVQADGFPISSVVVDKLYLFAAETYDVLIEPIDRSEISNVWDYEYLAFEMNWEGDGECYIEKGATYRARAKSYLVYTLSQKVILSGLMNCIKEAAVKALDDGFTSYLADLWKVYNPAHLLDFSTNPAYIKTSDLRSLSLSDQESIESVDSKFYFFADSFVGNGFPNINNISFAQPSSPLLTQFHDVPKEDFCTIEDRPECSRQFCQCINMYRIKLGSVVEFILIDEGNNGRYDIHSFHLHGHTFRVLAQEKVGISTTLEEIKQLDVSGSLKRNLYNPVYKNILAVPQGGYGIIRFVADNPGFWLLHCHLSFHLLGGMNVVLWVGELNDIVEPPPNFPRCGSYTDDFNL